MNAVDNQTFEQQLAGIDAELTRGRGALLNARNSLSALLKSTQNAALRGQLNQRLWDCRCALNECSHFYSQSGQDEYLTNRIFNGKRNGTFLEIGGYDGVTGSNCLYFEQHLGWRGLVVEPVSTLVKKIRTIRISECVEAAIGGASGEGEFLEVMDGYRQMSGLTAHYDTGLLKQVQSDARYKGSKKTVPILTFADLLKQHSFDQIDFISLDVEGAELDALTGFPFDEVTVHAWCIENNLNGTDVPNFMFEKKYSLLEKLGVDEIYVREDSGLK